MSNSLDQSIKKTIYAKVLGDRIKNMRKYLGYKSFKHVNIPELNNNTYAYIERGDKDVRLFTLLDKRR